MIAKLALVLAIVLILPLAFAQAVENDIDEFLLEEEDVKIDMDHPLHFAMLASLEAEENLAPDEEGQANAKLRKASRWAVLASKHAKKGQIKFSVEATEKYNVLIDEVDKLGPIVSQLAKAKDFDAKFAAIRAHHIAILERVLAKVPTNAKSAISNVIDRSKSKFGNKTKNFTHLECVNLACVKVAGKGDDTCTSNADCTNQTNQTHLACVSQACVSVAGAGTNECTTNTQCTNQTNQTSPDLIVLSISFTKSNLTVNASNSTNMQVNITAVVQNIGNAIAAASTTQFLISSTVNTKSTQSLAPSESTHVSSLFTLARGNYTVTVTADWLNVVSESNEANNNKTLSFVV